MKRMVKWVMVCMIASGTAASAAPEGQRYETGGTVRFRAVDVFVDSGDDALAAYQFELKDRSGAAKIVGLEGGEHEAFREPPYYDSAALTKERVIVAAFSLAKELPKGKTRVARIHLQIAGEGAPEFEIELQASASADGQRIPAKVTFVRGDEG